MDDDSLQHEIIMAIPELHEETTKTLIEHLRDIIGVRKREDLLFVESDDINSFLTPIQSRRLIQAFRKGEKISVRQQLDMSYYLRYFKFIGVSVD